MSTPTVQIQKEGIETVQVDYQVAFFRLAYLVTKAMVFDGQGQPALVSENLKLADCLINKIMEGPGLVIKQVS